MANWGLVSRGSRKTNATFAWGLESATLAAQPSRPYNAGATPQGIFTMADGSLINLGELSKPATVLIEKISDAVGGIAKPWQIKRVANAEAEAEKIKALAQIEITDIQQRALVRMVREEGIQQGNIESITAGAIPHLKETAKTDELDDDWIAHFFAKARIVTDSDMQQLWSRILAGEANNPASFAKRTVDIVSTISKGEAEQFSKLCTGAWMFGTMLDIVYWHSMDNNPYSAIGVTFSQLLNMDSIGLIKFNTGIDYVITTPSESIPIHYYGTPLNLEFSPTDSNPNRLSRGHISLTQAGKELAVISSSNSNAGYAEAVLKNWLSMGHLLSCPIGSRAKWLRLSSMLG
ncbi:DUF2806 domain-containing protein [Shinella sp.]|uniref:DUF2806 domain-containing protein n=1 Tax=Shinella sp. TaxID=1870904 RepID=UPI00403647E3